MSSYRTFERAVKVFEKYQGYKAEPLPSKDQFETELKTPRLYSCGIYLERNNELMYLIYVDFFEEHHKSDYNKTLVNHVNKLREKTDISRVVVLINNHPTSNIQNIYNAADIEFIQHIVFKVEAINDTLGHCRIVSPEFVKSINLPAKKLPEINLDDTISIWLNAKHGDVIEHIVDTDTCNKKISYRYVNKRYTRGKNVTVSIDE